MSQVQHMGHVAGEEASASATEEELVLAARNKSSQAWTEIYRRHYGKLLRYIKARIFDEATAEDLTSEVFVRALKGIQSYKYEGRPLLAWLYRIARNAVADHQRQSMGRRPQGLGGIIGLPRRGVLRLTGHGPAQEGPADVPDTSAGASDPATLAQNIDLRDALNSLPESQRDVVILRYIVGLSAHQVADIIGKGPAAVYSLQARALVSLKKRLQ